MFKLILPVAALAFWLKVVEDDLDATSDMVSIGPYSTMLGFYYITCLSSYIYLHNQTYIGSPHEHTGNWVLAH